MRPVSLAAAQIMSGMEDLVIAGGTEMMSYHGQIADPSKPPMIDSGNLELRAMHPSHSRVFVPTPSPPLRVSIAMRWMTSLW